MSISGMVIWGGERVGEREREKEEMVMEKKVEHRKGKEVSCILLMLELFQLHHYTLTSGYTHMSNEEVSFVLPQFVNDTHIEVVVLLTHFKLKLLLPHRML